MPKRMNFSDELPAAVTAEAAGHMNTSAREKFADGTNTTKRHETNASSKIKSGTGHKPNAK